MDWLGFDFKFQVELKLEGKMVSKIKILKLYYTSADQHLKISTDYQSVVTSSVHPS